MKNLILALFLIFSHTSFAQHKDVKSLEKIIYKVMDEGAQALISDSKTSSVSIGIVKDGKSYTKHYGEIDKGKGNKATNHTLFEVASITKIYTGTLVAKAVLDKKIELDDDIRKYLRGSYPNLEYEGTAIRIKDLVSFKSGFDKDLPDRRELFKNEDDSLTFRLKKMEESYTKELFFNDLKTIKLDTLPGKVYKYSNASVQLAAYILENVYQESYETLLKEFIFSPLGLKQTKLYIDKNDTLANGYNANHMKMPELPNSLWGASGYLKSSMEDMIKFLAFELDRNNPIVLESQRNILQSDGSWNGYFWDGINVDNYGLNCWKHGGAFGTQNMFVVYPEIKLGISVIVNISDKDTGAALNKTIVNVIDKLENQQQKKLYGYQLRKDTIVFRYEHSKKLAFDLIKSVSIAGSFNDWNSEHPAYQMKKNSDNSFKLSLPVGHFVKGKTYLFKFVINKESWLIAPKNALNAEKEGDRNLILKIN